ncbi:uncharacterized protein HMPREF1541_09914 [Cyphellophora europaea CBS 101466]|uniref:G protein-coupled receptor GPR1/2/3 C-terminal domain-containing protein n=1 Tax=Cyphellophora europaea (strain CBS 101466) TaxID=1220924 RepID=W2SAI8_CYPE1|nr:uncharacterized protein HMPREF1541_09914 [Cyphellophora europaea CBS 101466]ETN45038.1 hypothetical protein HMPREF1541_09914 [Cyphellophora europaea CBS 101466]
MSAFESLPGPNRPDSLDPLPPVLQRGLVAVAFFGILSLAASSGLFIFLSYKLCRWYYKGHLANGANQFLLLIYNLLLADIQQAMAFSLTAVWVAENKIEVGTTTCWANGWFVSTGDLASGVFILSIALHTWFAAVKGRSISNKVFYGWIIMAWVFVYVMGVVTVVRDPNVYVRAGAWCWVHRDYEAERLWLHYFWIFLCMFATIVIYALIYMWIYRSSTTFHTITTRSTNSDPATLKRASKYMIIFPVVYVCCTLPLAAGRMAAMTGMVIPYWWYCVAGAAITSNGWLDVLLYVMTRRVLIFSRAPPPRNDFGFDTLGWKHGGDNSLFWGTTTTIEGPLTHAKPRQKQVGFLSRGRSTPGSRRHSDEDHIAPPPEGVISTKTTVDVQTHAMPGMYASSDFSMIEMEDKSDRARSPGSATTTR